MYYLQSRYYDPETGRFINADALVTTGQGLLGNNMFAYCLNNPVQLVDPGGMCGYIYSIYFWSDCGRADCPESKNYISFTASMGVVLSAGIGPLSVSVQASIVTDSSNRSELQIAFSAPNIFSTGLPSTEEMLADIGKEQPDFKFGLSAAATMSFTNAPSVTDLHGPTYSVSAAGPGVALEYNAIPNSVDPNRAYSGVTIISGAVTPGVSATMSNTFYSTPIPFSVFDIAAAAYNGLWRA